MRRRSFLKAVAATLVAPALPVPKPLTINGIPIVYKRYLDTGGPHNKKTGITNADLKDLIATTLEDLPKEALGTAFGHSPSYEFAHLFRKG